MTPEKIAMIDRTVILATGFIFTLMTMYCLIEYFEYKELSKTNNSKSIQEMKSYTLGYTVICSVITIILLTVIFYVEVM